MSNKMIIIVGAIIVYIVSAGFSYSYFASVRSNNITSPTTTASSEIAPGKETEVNTEFTDNPGEPATEECPINGKLFPKSYRDRWEKRRPLGIMVENSKTSRPQSGINAADITYEIVAEGGITRFLNIFYCQDAKFVGPVRSSRIYFIRFLQEYGDYPLYAHVGGANKEGPADALGEIKELGWFAYNDMDPLYGMSFPYFWRDYERLPGVDTEHTVYTNTAKLWEFAETKRKLTNVDEDGKAWDAKFTKWTFANDAAPDKRGTTNKASFGFWDQFANDYSVDWIYDKTSNSYKRENGGEAHNDKNTGKSIEAKNVIVILAKESVANDGYEKGQHLLYTLTSGNGYLFQNGNAEKITWSKADGESRTKFTGANGKEITLVRGKIFVEVLPLGNKVTY